ncbi:MAG: hypothetical protein Q7R96_00710 [Nanoarchaeota archaeon]|nr:hypothetical protein [Nanoarchaeota archaeon]
MYQNEGFSKVREIPGGTLTMKLPGTDIHLRYVTGTVRVNTTRNIGLLTLQVNDFEAVEVPGGEGLTGIVGDLLRVQLEDPEARQQVLDKLIEQGQTLAYSKTREGKDVYTIPGFGEEDSVIEIDGAIVCTHGTSEEEQWPENVYATHVQAIGIHKTQTIENLEAITAELVTRANTIYIAGLKMME